VHVVRWVVLLAFAAGCGFQALPNGDGGMDLGSADLSGLDLTGADLTGGAPDMTMSGGGTGPGPAGALPAGFCCASNSECRSRRCRSINSQMVCTDDCDHDGICTAYGANMKCDSAGTGECIGNGAASPACVDPSTYHYGTKAIGSCCSSGFDKSGAECVGGLCDATGPQSNPFFCTQGCDGNTPCPGPYTCFLAAGTSGFCALPDPNAAYTCQ
jgi:hypothetical protein